MYKYTTYITGLNRHFAPAIKEWTDSVYFYNKNKLKSIPSINDLTYVLVRDYFNTHSRKSIGISVRVRSKMIRFSSKKVFVSKPEIKYNNDKSIITVYTFDKERQYFIRKLFFFWRKPIIYNSWITNNSKKKIGLTDIKTASALSRSKYMISKQDFSLLKSKRRAMFGLFKNKTRFSKSNVPFFGLKFQNNLNFIRYKLSKLSRALYCSDKLLSYTFMLYILSLFNIELNNILNLENKSLISKTSDHSINLIAKNEIMPKNLEFFTNYLWNYIENNLINTGNLSHTQVKQLYKQYLINKHKQMINSLYKDQAKLLYNYTRMEMNKVKFTGLITLLKTLLTRLHNKTVELNIVNLKYIHLNGDLLSGALASKFKGKLAPLKAIQKGFGLVRMPLSFNHRFNAENLSYLNEHSNLKIDNLLGLDEKIGEKGLSLSITEKINLVLNKSFPKAIIHKTSTAKGSTSLKKNSKLLKNDSIESKINQVLNLIKYKWVGGIRLEAAGRLTRRNTAARSAYIVRYKGNLKNNQFFIRDDSFRPMNIVLMRNDLNVNTQYTFTKSKRRIGSFGLKTWISGY